MELFLNKRRHLDRICLLFNWQCFGIIFYDFVANSVGKFFSTDKPNFVSFLVFPGAAASFIAKILSFDKLSRNEKPLWIPSQNSEYPRIFQVTGANQNARKSLSTDLVNTNNRYQLSMKIDFQYQSIEIDKEKSCDFDWYRFPIEIDKDFFIDCYRWLSIIIGKDLRDYSIEVQHLQDVVRIIESFSRDIMQFF